MEKKTLMLLSHLVIISVMHGSLKKKSFFFLDGSCKTMEP